MLLVETYLKKSLIEGAGNGLFLASPAVKGTKIWCVHYGFDREITENEFTEYMPCVRKFIHKYAYKDLKTGNYILCMDNARFMNHSSEPTLDNDGFFDIASRDLSADEELTCDYYLFDALASIKLDKNYEYKNI